MTRDQVLTHIKDKHLKSKLYRSENLTLSKLLEVVSQYHDKDALILVQPEEQVNRVELAEKQSTGTAPMKFQGRCWNCNKLGHLAKDCRCSSDHVCESCGRQGHFSVCCRYPPRTCQQHKPHHQPWEDPPAEQQRWGTKQSLCCYPQSGRQGIRRWCILRLYCLHW